MTALSVGTMASGVGNIDDVETKHMDVQVPLSSAAPRASRQFSRSLGSPRFLVQVSDPQCQYMEETPAIERARTTGGRGSRTFDLLVRRTMGVRGSFCTNCTAQHAL